jgi:serine/threonine protein kinase
VSVLHKAGFVHGDLELHNMVVCTSPLQVHLIDFENAKERGETPEQDWKALCNKDLKLILKEAVYLQCALGEQAGPLAAASLDQIDSLFEHPNRFKRAIHRQAGL